MQALLPQPPILWAFAAGGGKGRNAIKNSEWLGILFRNRCPCKSHSNSERGCLLNYNVEEKESEYREDLSVKL